MKSATPFHLLLRATVVVVLAASIAGCADGSRRSASANYIGAATVADRPFNRDALSHGATGLHAGYLPGYAASHGCIRMPEALATDFFSSVAVGTPVTVELEGAIK